MSATEKPSLVLTAPLSGWSTPLDEVPDPVFAGRMLGDGVAIDPTGATLHAPCDGEIVTLADSMHAVTLRGACGAEILMHIGIDTVALAGEGFQAHVKPGQRVAAGERLITFDLDLLARRAKSLLTPILLLEGSGFAISRSIASRELAAGDVLMEIVRAGALPQRSPDRQDSVQAGKQVGDKAREEADEQAGEDARDEVVEVRRLRVALEHGIHARPAAQIVGALKGVAGEVSLAAQGRTANARSTVALMKLGVRKDQEVEVRASGKNAGAAIAAIAAVLAGAHEEGGRAPGGPRPTSPAEPARPAGPAAARQPPTLPRGQGPKAGLAPASMSAAAIEARAGITLSGVAASRGLAVGEAVPLLAREMEVAQAGAGIAHETSELQRAKDQVRARLQSARASASATAREIVDAHLALLEDPELGESALALIGEGTSAAFAWRQAIRGSIEALRALENPRMAERVDDLLDLERQVVAVLSGAGAAPAQELPPDAVLVAEELLPSQLVALDATRLAGICLAAGGATSHVSILAAAMGIPALVAIGPGVRTIREGTPLLLDADAGQLHVDPGVERLAAARRQLELRAARRAAEREAAQRDCRTADGERIEVFANIGSLAEAQAAVRNGAEGCGLLRTEFLFLERETPPTEAEQHAAYQQLAGALAGRLLTIRTLDIGGDKPIPYLPLPAEENPALGLRGVRTSLWRPDLLRQQLRAILGVRPQGQCRILLPMITDVAEIRSVRAMIEEARAEIGRRESIELGVMIETPASALMADCIAAEADFFSIGTNDLTQYTLAIDRGHPELAGRLDALHPAVLRLIARTAEAAHARKRRVAVCGGLASDPTAAPILIGLGVHELSAVPSVVPQLKALIHRLTIEECTRLARRVLEQESAEAVRSLAMAAVSLENAPASLDD